MQGLVTGVRADGSPVNGMYRWKYTRTTREFNESTGLWNVKVEDVGLYKEEAIPVHTDNLQIDYEQHFDENGRPMVGGTHAVLYNQESLVAKDWYNRFLVDISVGKLIYLPQRQSLSINLSVSNLLNNTHMKTGGYQQGRIPVSSVQGEGFNGSNKIQKVEISNNVRKFPAKYYYAWGANFFLNITYKF